MKTIFAVLFILTASIAVAGSNEIIILKETIIETKNNIMVKILCVDGYKYLLVFDNGYRTSAPNIIQMMREKRDLDYGRSMPVRCNE